MTNIRRKFRQRLEQKLDRPTIVPGVLGNGIGRVVVPGRANYVYVRLAGGIVTEVFNVRVRAQYDLPVICGYDPLDPSRFQVLSIMGSSAEAAKFVMEGGYAPANRYRWMFPGGGQDPLFVEGPQIMPGRIIPSGLKITVYPLVVWTGSGWSALGGSTEIDLTASVPETEGQARFVLVTVSSSGIVSTAGTAVALADLGLDDLPDAPSGTLYVLGAVRLYYGQTVIQEGRSETDLLDLRWPMRHEHDGGGVHEASRVITDTEGIKIISNYLALRGDLDANAIIRFYEIVEGGDKQIGAIYSDWGGSAEHDGMLWITAKRNADSPWDAAGITLNASDTETGKYARIWLRTDGVVKIYGVVKIVDGLTWDGWQPDSDTWKYVSATSFKIEGKNVTERFPVGTKIKLSQTSVKYFYVLSATYSTDTTVTVTGGSTYSLANAAITSPHYSYADTPQGFPHAPGGWVYSNSPFWVGTTGAPLTSTSWNGNAYSTTAKTLIDLSNVFGIPAGVRAVEVRIAARDSGSAASSICQFALYSSDTTTIPSVVCWPSGKANDTLDEGGGVVPCNSDGDCYWSCAATGDKTLDVWWYIKGYLI